MKVSELIEKLSKMKGTDTVRVLARKMKATLGSLPSVDIVDIHDGFDWNEGSVLFSTDANLVQYSDAEFEIIKKQMKNNNSAPRIYVDMDGVIADFEKRAKLLNMSPDEYKLKAGSYINLSLYDGAKEALEKLEKIGYDIWIATKIPSKNPLASTEKLEWINLYFPQYIKKVIITPDKGCLQGQYLIDDRPHKANCAKFQGTFIHFGSAEYPSWKEVIEYFENKFKIIETN